MTAQTPVKPEINTTAIITAVLNTLGDPTDTMQSEARQAFEAGDYDKVRQYAAIRLGDSYLRSLTYLCSVSKAPPTLAVIAAEACRAAADWQKEWATQKLGKAMADVFGYKS